MLANQAPANQVKPLYLQYAKLEEDYGLAKRAMKIDGDNKIEIVQKELPCAVLGGLIRKREDEKNGEIDAAKDKDNEKFNYVYSKKQGYQN